MSTANKLSYLNDTKSLLRTSLNKFGSNILTTDTFRSYDTKLNEIYDKLPKVTQSGAGFTLLDVQNGQVDDFKMIGVDLEQDTTETIIINEWEQGDISGSTGDTVSDNSAIRTQQYIKVFPNVLYNISRTIYNSFMKFRFYDTNYNFLGTQGNVNITTNVSEDRMTANVSSMQLTINDSSVAYMKIADASNNLNTIYTITTNATPSPNYPQEIKVVEGRQVITDKGKNLLNISKNVNGYWYKNGVLTANADWSYINDFIEIKPNIQYTISRDSSELNESQFSIEEFDENKNYIKQNVLWQNNTNKYSITTDSNTKYVICNYRNEYAHTDLQFESGDNRTDYEPYYEPVSYNIDLQLANIYLAKMPNTSYKNRIYKNNGNWYFEENVRKYIIDGTESWTTQSAYSGYYRYMFVLMENYKNDNLSYGVVGMNSHFIQRITQPHGDYEYLYLQAANNNLLSVYIQIKNLSTIANFKTWLSENNVVVWYPLVNPVTTQITNTTLINQLEAISVHTGTNIISLSSDNNMTPQIEITRLKELERLS
jgi:hypothetical protein